MFDIQTNELGQVAVSGRLDAAQAERAQQFLDKLAGECVIYMSSLEYVSSAGLGVLLKTHKRLMAGGKASAWSTSGRISMISFATPVSTGCSALNCCPAEHAAPFMRKKTCHQHQLLAAQAVLLSEYR